MTMPVPARSSAVMRLAVALRLALRELRGGMRGFGVFLTCLALGVAAIAGVGSVARALSDGLAREGGVILGGDVSFSLVHRETRPAERAFVEENGTVSKVATLRAMARTAEGETTLVELKAVDARYPLTGAVKLEPEGPLEAALARRGDAFGAVADPALLVRLGIVPGARITLGETKLEISATLAAEPDRLAVGVGFGPRLIVSEAALRATGLLQPGSLVRWIYRVRLADPSDASLAKFIDEARVRFPEAGWEVRTRGGATPRLERNVRRFAEFLTLVGLTALLVGGVGVANAVKYYLERKREAIATLKAVGATGGMIFSIYLTEIGLIALLGIAVGLLIGLSLPFLIAWGFGKLIPIPLVAAVHVDVLALALAYGLLVALAFALWPLGRAHDVPVSALFRDMVEPDQRLPRRRYMALAVLAVALLAALAIGTAEIRRIAFIYVALAAAVFIVLRLLASGLMAAARRLPRPRSTTLRLALANVHRPGALTPTVVLSLGLGLSLLVALALIEGNLHRQLTSTLPEQAPSFFFLDIPSAEAGRFTAFIAERAPGARLVEVPMLRGRIVQLKGIAAEQVKPDPDAAWVLQSDRGITFADEIPQGSMLAEGNWWPKGYEGPTLVSFEKKLAEGLGLKIGDTIAVNVLGRTVEAKIANLRVVEWESLGINFVMLFSPNAFRDAPHTLLATLTYPDGGRPETELALLKEIAGAFPAVSTVRVKEALEAINSLVSDLALAMRGASLVTLFASVLVLAGALAAGHHARVYDAVILKTLGATRRRLVLAYGLEYTILGLVTALVATAAGGAAAAYVVEEVMHFRFSFDPATAALAVGVAVALTVLFGLIGTWRALGEKPARILRNL
ncbi:MAG: FtsX-like permease family protein [Xanthobacteraceae bacterium]|nr:FtsX-like permease family protein [Xanthobacteraceae bacterium]